MAANDPWDERLAVPRAGPRAGVALAYALAAVFVASAAAIGYTQLRPATSTRERPAPQPAARTEPGPRATVSIGLPAVTVAMPAPGATVPPPAVVATPPAAMPVPRPPAVAALPPPPAATPALASPAGFALGAAPQPTRQDPIPPAPAPAVQNRDIPWQLLATNGLPAPPPTKPEPPARRAGLCPVDSGVADIGENTALGRLPKIAAAGCMPWMAYAGDFDRAEQKPRLALVVLGLGLNEAITQRAIDVLPAGVTLAFMPDAPNLDRLISRARDRRHEALIVVPLQGASTQQPGMPPVSKGLVLAENLARVRAVLARATGYVGVVMLPSPASEDDATIRPIVRELADRGLLVLEIERWQGKSRVHALSREMGVPYRVDIDSPIAWVDRFGPDQRETTARDVDTGLAEVERYVRNQRYGLGWSLARPLAIERMALWAQGASGRGVVLAPVSGVIECGETCRARLPRRTPGGETAARAP